MNEDDRNAIGGNIGDGFLTAAERLEAAGLVGTVDNNSITYDRQTAAQAAWIIADYNLAIPQPVSDRDRDAFFAAIYPSGFTGDAGDFLECLTLGGLGIPQAEVLAARYPDVPLFRVMIWSV